MKESNENIQKEKKYKDKKVIKIIQIIAGLIIIGIGILVYIGYHFSDTAIKGGTVLLIAGIAVMVADGSVIMEDGEESYIENIDKIDNEFYDKGYVPEDDDTQYK